MHFALLTDLLEATGDAHTPRTMVRALARGLATRANLIRVELQNGERRVIAELDGDDWRCVEVPRRGPAAIALVPGLRVVPRGPLPAFFAAAGFRAALTQVIAAAQRHLDVVSQVAELSRRAHTASRDLRADLDRLRHPAIVARSPAMRAVLERAELVARHPTTVLITGESGTGKELLAHEIHRGSPRAARPMLQLNCAALPEALVESELFGHERGAFTGADRTHLGVFERAHHGTLFLDEVGELAPAAQAKLLRVLQERQVRRVGGTSLIDVDVRVIAATNRPLAAMVRDGRFREDLYHRLHVFALAVPPLRERRADLGPLTSALLAGLAARLHLPAPPLSRTHLTRLAAHDWPGNVRELANVLESALILGGGPTLHLPADLASSARSASAAPPASFDDATRSILRAALHRTRGKLYGRDGAAAQLGLDPGTLQSKMRKLGLRRTDFTA